MFFFMPAILTDTSHIHDNRQKYGYVLLAGLFGIITTFITYYGYGLLDQVEQLPIVFRRLDSSYLVNDFFVNATQSSMARGRFADMVAWMAGNKEHLPILFFVLTAIANIAISIITYCFARSYFNYSALAGLLAAAVVMSVHSFELGWNTHMYAINLVAYVPAIPFLLSAIWMACERRVVTSIILCIIATEVHPLMGLETGWLIIVALFIISAKDRFQIRNHTKQFILALILLIAASCYIAYPLYAAPKIDDKLFINILARFRHPHHYMPGSFATAHYVYALLFVGTAAFAVSRCEQINKQYNKIVRLIAISIIALCVFGYVFTELIPSRAWVIAQPFRLLFYVKWLGLIMIAGAISNFQTHKLTRIAYSATLLYPLGALVTIPRIIKQKQTIWLDLVMLLLSIVVLNVIGVSFSMFLHIALFLLLIAAVIGYRKAVLRVVVVFVGVIGLLFATRNSFYYSDKYLYLAGLELKKIPQYFNITSELDVDGDDIIQYIRQNTPKDAVLLTPPFWGQTRLTAERAIVVDYKAFPFGDSAMLSWYNRMVDCYGKEGDQQVKKDELNSNYKAINDTKLNMVKTLYNASYVVLHKETVTANNVVYTNNRYKLVRLSQQ